MPIQDIRRIDGAYWYKAVDADGWMDVGIIPIPRSRWRVFLYHFCHGMLMQYPLIEILKFSITTSNMTHWRSWSGREIERVEWVRIKPRTRKHTGIRVEPLVAYYDQYFCRTDLGK